LLKTIDGGNNWIKLNTGIDEDLQSVFFINEDIGFVAGTLGVVLKTIDGGESWTPQLTGTSRAFNSAFFLDENNGYVVGDYDIIMSNSNAGVVSNNPVRDVLHKVKVSPNPNKGRFTIEFKNNAKVLVNIKILELSGRIIFETISSDEHYTFSDKSLQPGMYGVVITGDNIFYTEKVIVN